MWLLLCPSIGIGDPREVVLASGSPLGSYFRVANDIKAAFEDSGFRIRVIETSGSVENIDLMLADKAKLALVQKDALARLASQRREILPMIELFPEEVHLFTSETAQITRFADLEGKTIACGSHESGSCLTARQINNLYGMHWRIHTLAADRMLAAVRSAELDAGLFVGGKPIRLLENASGIRMLDIPQKTGFDAYYRRDVISQMDYPWMERTVHTYSVPAVLAVAVDQILDEGKLVGSLLMELLTKESVLRKHGHAKWKEVVFTGTGLWRVHPVAREILNACFTVSRFGFTCDRMKHLGSP